MKEVIVIGHKNPDTDSVVSAIVMSQLINQAQGPVSGNAIPKISGRPNKETEFVLNHFEQDAPDIVESLVGEDVFLIDHSEFSQSVDGIEEANLVGVLDHHNMGGIKTASSIFYKAEPIGSTATIIAKIFSGRNIELNKKQAGLLLAAIISDTLKFTSPTTTKIDKDVAQKLVEISGEDIDQLAEAMFEAKSDIFGISALELVSKDYKEFEVGGKKFGIGVWETVKPEKIEALKEEILFSLEKTKEEKGLDLIFFGIVDIIGNKTKVIFLDSDKEALEEVFGIQSNNNSLVLEGVVSRKKQMAPLVINYFEKK
ncbi:MAG: manganese-dependent inorganic pyrophosphatase [Patescibacteria group bacterium]